MSKKLLAVFGATGNQGGSVANFVLNDPQLSEEYAVRAITRDASNPRAEALKSKGVEIVEADLSNPSSLKSALKDAHTVYALTNTQYSGNTKEIETTQAKALCDEALNQGVKYLIWSSMSHPRKISGGNLSHIDHFDVKAEIEQHIRSLPIKSAFFAPGSFMQNFSHTMKPRPSPAGDGTYVIANLCNPSTKLPLIDITDTGKWIGAILAEPDKYEGKFLAAAQSMYSMTEIADIVSKVSGKTVKHTQLPDEVFKGFLPEGFRQELFEMFLLFRDYGYYGEEMEGLVDWAAKQAKGHLNTLKEYLEKEPIAFD
ncbi:NAD(P)-binding protein [Lindgomyces ingoldianus]|uniref:NAD(P)-binding protein n=1 Tax=Lindgomyces ingoldianus TaxID=673940 RepID=A0ACB6QR13_9PLEO|nr:NAD(P)-binding protein [Lindgomyces ingoldianus]KAF2469013.1 NAD(P)-binding protein [Lindgomyces ingoldianus]